MGASTYSTESVIERQYYSLGSTAILLSTHKENKLLEQYSEAFKLVESNVKNLPTEKKQLSEVNEKMKDISCRLGFVYKIYKQMMMAADDMHYILGCCSNSGNIENARPSKSSDVDIEDIPFDFEGFSLSLFKCIALLDSAYLYYEHVSNNHLQGDSEYYMQNIDKCQESQLELNKEELTSLTNILSDKEEILNLVFCKGRSNSKQIFNALCRLACVICITIHNNCDQYESETTQMFSSLSAAIYLCERLAQPLSIREIKVFPGQLIANTIFSLSAHKNTKVKESSNKCLHQFKSSPKLYSQINTSNNPIKQL
jgi:hypothetical protein